MALPCAAAFADDPLADPQLFGMAPDAFADGYLNLVLPSSAAPLGASCLSACFAPGCLAHAPDAGAALVSATCYSMW